MATNKIKYNVSEIFDIRTVIPEPFKKHSAFNNIEFKGCKTPFTFFVNIGEFYFLPQMAKNGTCGFCSEAEANEVREKVLKDYFKNKVVVVLKNRDFTEGRGPMYPHKAFKNPLDAHKYIMGEKGIYDSPQYNYHNFGININQELYGSINYNGYDIEIMNIE